MPRAPILAPQRRSTVSSMPTTTGPSRTRVATSTRSRRCATARADQRAVLRTRWWTAKLAVRSRAMTRRAAVTVRRPGASRAPATRTSTWRQIAAVKHVANGRSRSASSSEACGGIGLCLGLLGCYRRSEPAAREAFTRPGRPDPIRERIAAYHFPRGGVEVVRASRGYTLYSRRTGGPVARLRPTGDGDRVQVSWWRRDAWGAPGDFGPVVMPLDEALAFIAAEGFFWIQA